MQRMPVLLCVVALPAIILVVGCTGGGSQGERAHPQQGHTAKELKLLPEHGSGVSGTASFGDVSDGVVVKLRLRDLPEPDTLYLSHVHPGTCAELEEEEHQEHAEDHEEEGRAHENGEHAEEGKGDEHTDHGSEGGEEIEYPLSQVESDSEGDGSSTTTLQDTSVDKLFSGEPKHVNVHEAGSGDPPILACAAMKRAG